MVSLLLIVRCGRFGNHLIQIPPRINRVSMNRNLQNLSTFGRNKGSNGLCVEARGAETKATIHRVDRELQRTLPNVIVGEFGLV